jgi:hypothetical protein
MRAGGWRGEDVLEPLVRDFFYQTYVWNRICTIAAMRGLTIRDITQRLGAPATMSSFILKGERTLKLSDVFACSRILGVPVYTLFAGMDEPACALPHDVVQSFVHARVKRERGTMAKRFRHYLTLRFGEGAVALIEHRLEMFDRLMELKAAVANAGVQRRKPELIHPRISVRLLPKLPQRPARVKGVERPLTLPPQPSPEPGEMISAWLPVPWADPHLWDGTPPGPDIFAMTKKARLANRLRKEDRDPLSKRMRGLAPGFAAEDLDRYVTRRRKTQKVSPNS